MFRCKSGKTKMGAPTNGTQEKLQLPQSEREVLQGNFQAFEGNGKLIRGNGNKITGNGNIIEGNSNKITGDDNEIRGNCNHVTGYASAIVGNMNHVTGDDNDMKGNMNSIKGNRNLVVGNMNNMRGMENTAQGNLNNNKMVEGYETPKQHGSSQPNIEIINETAAHHSSSHSRERPATPPPYMGSVSEKQPCTEILPTIQPTAPPSSVVLYPQQIISPSAPAPGISTTNPSNLPEARIYTSAPADVSDAPPSYDDVVLGISRP